MDSVLIPSLIRHTSSCGPRWMAVLSQSPTPASKHFWEEISHPSIQTGRGMSHFPQPALRTALPHPAFLLPGCYLCLAILLPEFYMCIDIFLYKYIHTHSHVAKLGSFCSTLVPQMHVLWKWSEWLHQISSEMENVGILLQSLLTQEWFFSYLLKKPQHNKNTFKKPFQITWFVSVKMIMESTVM